MNMARLFDDTVTLFIPTPSGGYEARLLSGVLFSAAHGISGGDSTPTRHAVLYFFDMRSQCIDPAGRACKYVRYAEWLNMQDYSGHFTFVPSGGSFLCEGDARDKAVPPDGAYRITSVERPSAGRRLLRHFKITAQ
ncbi:MAG TPA: hypothetical protein PK778_03065 [Bacillota bacterium]|nr:hypothetical protein [Clostridiales bacterium]HPT84958.1 hypothetical protein [Bacillota bacterium]